MLTERIGKRYGKLSEEQARVVEHVEGPLLVVAGPGSGKTTVMVLRALNLILGGYAEPREVGICTFTQRAAGELRRRFDLGASTVGLDQVDDVRIETIHGLSREVLRGVDRHAGLGPEFRTLDGFEQVVFIDSRLGEMVGRDDAKRMAGCWGVGGVAKGLAERFNVMAERMIDPDALLRSGNVLHRVVGESYRRYVEMLHESGMVDFAHLQRWALEELERNAAGVPLARDLRWLMVDEYQDTNCVQERLLTALVGRPGGNLAVVGDDDQAIYGFRGATVRNLLDFPERHPGCRVMELSANYRSRPGIVDACNRWMEDAAGDGREVRHGKTMEPAPWAGDDQYPSVVRLDGQEADDEAQRVARLAGDLVGTGVIGRYGQVALLLNSVQERSSGPYLEAMRSAGVPFQVHGVRRFFERREVSMMAGCFALLLGWTERCGTGDRGVDRYLDRAVNELLRSAPDRSGLVGGLYRWQQELSRLSETGGSAGWGLLDYFYALLALEPFAGLLGYAGVMADLAGWSRLLGVFQRHYGHEKIEGGRLKTLRREFFSRFLPLAMGCGVMPDGMGCRDVDPDSVQVMTVHQSKGLEFSVVIAGGFGVRSRSRRSEHELVRYAPGWDPASEAECGSLDESRRRYVALTRARDLLVLSSAGLPAEGVSSVWDRAPDWNDDLLGALDRQRFSPVREPDEMPDLSVTRDVLLYETCPRRYEYFRHHGFEERRSGTAEIGTLLHGVVDLMVRLTAGGADGAEIDAAISVFLHEAAVQADIQAVGDIDAMVRERVEGFRRFVDRNGVRLLDSERELLYRGDGWRLKGRADLMVELEGGVAIVDVKTGGRLDEGSAVMDRYRRQLMLYELMAGQNAALAVAGVAIYWAGQEPDGERLTMVENSVAVRTETRRRLVETVDGIRSRDFAVAEPPGGDVCARCELLMVCTGEGAAARSRP